MFEKHLADSGKTYKQHFMFGMKAFIFLLMASLTSFIHAIIPDLFKFTSQKIVLKLMNESEKNRNKN